MKKIMIVIAIMLCVFTYANDTIFVLQSEVEKRPIEIVIPSTVYNNQASLDQNGQAWFYKKTQVLNTKNNIEYNKIFRIITPTTRKLIFANRNVVFNSHGQASKEIAWELIVVMLITCVTMYCVQWNVNRYSPKIIYRVAIVLIVASILTLPLFANQFMVPIILTFWVLATTLILSFKIFNDEYSIKKKRNLFLMLNIFLAGIIVYFLFYLYFVVYIFYILGLIIGILIYSLYVKTKRKRRREFLHKNVIY
jgi:hypothetical protein